MCNKYFSSEVAPSRLDKVCILGPNNQLRLSGLWLGGWVLFVQIELCALSRSNQVNLAVLFPGLMWPTLNHI